MADGARRSMGAAVVVALVLAAAYGLLLVGVYLAQVRLLYLPDIPSRHLQAKPSDIGLAYESVVVRTADGVSLDGWWVPAQRARGTVLFLHGNAGNISHRLDSLRVFHQLGLSTFIFDYRGYGRSEGKPSEQGTYQDARAAWDYLTLTRGIAGSRIVVFGRSLGGAVAAWLASREQPAALILESTFTSVPALGAELYPFLPVKWLSRFRYPTEEYLHQVSCPVLIIHSPADEVVPFEHALKLYAAAPEPKAMLRIRGGHNDGFLLSGEVYRRGLEGFLRRNLPP
jgi:fermentation-respiration switch protein FrsA (DUF1100 family)